MRLADGEAADRVSRTIEIDKLPRTLATQVCKRRALHDAELQLAEISVASGAFLKIEARAASPCRCALQRGFGFFTRRGRLDALIEDHGDVRPQRELNLRRFFRCEEMLRAVEISTEADGLNGPFSQFGKAEDRIATEIGVDDSRPRHRLLKPH